jgi:hypothetical protein
MSNKNHSEAALKYFSIKENAPVFCITTGRSGTGLLATLLDKCYGLSAHHESKPAFNEVRDLAWARSTADQQKLKSWWLDRKLPAMYESIGNGSGPHRIYVETSHMTTKGFIESLIELGVVPRFIVIRRDPRAVAKSLYALGTIPVKSKIGQEWCLNERDRTFFNINTDYSKLKDYQLCFLYCLETQARVNHYTTLVEQRGSASVHLEFDDLVSGVWKSKLAALMPIRPNVLAVLREKLFSSPEKVNEKEKGKKSQILEKDCSLEEIELLKMISSAKI